MNSTLFRQHGAKFDATIWRRYKPVLLEMFHHKCAFCEKRLDVYEGEVEHFRPRNGAQGQDGSFSPKHYWWLAYEWGNLLIVCKTCGYLKKSLFPVDGNRSEQNDDPFNEQYVLIDPCTDEPHDHFWFDTELCTIIAKTSRGQIMIEMLDLNRKSLIEQRKSDIRTIKTLINQNISNLDQYEYLKDFINFLSPSAPHFAIKRQFIIENILDLKPVFSKFDDLGAQFNSMFDIVDTVSYVGNGTNVWNMIDASETKELGSVADASGDEYYIRAQMITHIDVVNFMGIEEISLDFTDPESDSAAWMVVIGENSMGKTSLLQAITIALMGEEQFRSLKLDVSKFIRHGSDSGYIRVYLTGNSTDRKSVV